MLHRFPSRRLAGRLAATLGLATAVGGATVLATSGPAQAASSADWNRLAQCESGGNWSDNTGNGYYGGLQFTESTWQAYGGTAYAARPDLASSAAQMTIANRVLSAQGWSAWPACSASTGLAGTPTSGGASVVDAAPAVPAPATRSAGHAAGHTVRYVVRPGDTLTSISAAHGAGGWHAVYERNRAVIGADPNLIVPGDRLLLP